MTDNQQPPEYDFQWLVREAHKMGDFQPIAEKLANLFAVAEMDADFSCRPSLDCRDISILHACVSLTLAAIESPHGSSPPSGGGNPELN